MIAQPSNSAEKVNINVTASESDLIDTSEDYVILFTGNGTTQDPLNNKEEDSDGQIEEPSFVAMADVVAQVTE